MLKSTTQQSPIPVQRSPLKSEPLFLISGRGDKPFAPKDFKLHLDFLLYDCIRLHQHEGEPQFYTLYVAQIYYEFIGLLTIRSN